MKKHRRLWVILGLIVLVALWQFYKYKIVNKNVNKLITEKSKGLYSIHYEDIIVEEVSGSLQVKNVEVMPDTAVYNNMVKEKTDPPVLVRFAFPLLQIVRIKTPKALLNKEIEGGKVEIDQPTIEIGLNNFLKDTAAYNPGKDIVKQLLGKLVSIKMDSIVINKANLVVRDLKTGAVVFRGNNISWLLTDLLIDSTNKEDSSRIMYCRNVDIACDDIVIPSENNVYQLDIEKLRFTSQHNSFYIGSVKLIPRLTEDEFARSSVVQKDRYDIMLEDVGLLNINRESLWHKKIQADSLVVNKSSFKIYRDLSYPRDGRSRVGKYPQQQLMHLPVPVLFKKAVFIQSFIEYKEKNARSNDAGKVQFYNVHATIRNITNVHAAITEDNTCVVDFESKFLNEAPLTAKLTMFLKNPQGKFSIEGDLGSINALSLNALAQPMGLARVEKGTIDKMHFNFTGTDSASEGKVLMLYRDIKISLLKKDKEQNKYDKKGLLSLAANILIKNSNPGSNEKARVADVHYNRDTQKSFFNLLWKSIFTGVKGSVGVK